MGEVPQGVFWDEVLDAVDQSFHTVAYGFVDTENEFLGFHRKIIKADFVLAFQKRLHVEIEITAGCQFFAEILRIYHSAEIAAAVPDAGFETFQRPRPVIPVARIVAMIEQNYVFAVLQMLEHPVSQGIGQHKRSVLFPMMRLDPFFQCMIVEFHFRQDADLCLRIKPEIPGIFQSLPRSGEFGCKLHFFSLAGVRETEPDVRQFLKPACERDIFSGPDLFAVHADFQVALDIRLRQEVGDAQHDVDGGVMVKHFVFKPRQQYRVGVDGTHPFRVDIFVVIEAVHDAVFIFVFQRIGKLEHFKSAETGMAELFQVPLDRQFLEKFGAFDIVRHFCFEPLAADQFGKRRHVAGFPDAVCLEVVFPDSGAEIIKFSVQRFIIGDFDIVNRLVRDNGLQRNRLPADMSCDRGV